MRAREPPSTCRAQPVQSILGLLHLVHIRRDTGMEASCANRTEERTPRPARRSAQQQARLLLLLLPHRLIDHDARAHSHCTASLSHLHVGAEPASWRGRSQQRHDAHSRGPALDAIRARTDRDVGRKKSRRIQAEKVVSLFGEISVRFIGYPSRYRNVQRKAEPEVDQRMML